MHVCYLECLSYIFILINIYIKYFFLYFLQHVSKCLPSLRMNIRRHQKRFFILLIFVLSSILIIHFLWSNQENASRCYISPTTLKKLDELTSLVQEPLKALDLTFFLCYNSLWGALKVKGPLPWQNSLDLCALNNEISAIDEGYLAKTFKRYGLLINYNSWHF